MCYYNFYFAITVNLMIFKNLINILTKKMSDSK